VRTLRLNPTPPYSLKRTIGAFARFPEELVDKVVDGGFRRAFVDDAGMALLEARHLHDKNSEIEVRCIAFRSGSAAGRDSATFRIGDMLAVDEPILDVYERMSGNPVLRWLADELRGLRRPLDPSPFEGLVASILAQLVSIRAASVIRGRLVRRFGSSIEFEDVEYWRFPEPEEVSGSTIDELCNLGMTQTKARAILTVADLAAQGELDRDELGRASDDHVVAHLTALPGIGPWTAHWFLVNVLGRMSVVPSGDLGVRRSTGKWLLGGEMPSPAEVERVYEPFGEHRAYVAYYVLSAERYELSPPESTDR
jgi:DNA-3-methyladenine glycosylase II